MRMDSFDSGYDMCRNNSTAKIATMLQSFGLNGESEVEAQRLLRADILFGNKNEYDHFMRSLGLKSLLDLSTQYPDKIIACTLGADGARLYANGKEYKVNTRSVDKPFDTTGAGDAWAAGFLHEFIDKGSTFVQSMQRGNETAAEIIGVYGGRLGLTPT